MNTENIVTVGSSETPGIVQESGESATPQNQKMLSGIVGSNNPLYDAVKLQALLEERQKGKGCNDEMLEGMNVVVFSHNGHTS